MKVILVFQFLLITTFGGQLLSQQTTNIPHTEQEWFTLGKTKQKANLLEDAIKCYTEVLAQNPNNAKAYFNRGTAYESLGKFRNAIADFKAEVSINTSDAEAFEKLGDLCDEIGQTGESLTYYSDAIQIQPTENSLLNRAAGYVKAGYYKEALMDLNQVLSNNPNNHIAYATKGTIYFELDQTNDAFKMFKKALTLKPQDPYYISNLGKLYYKSGSPEHAITFLERAIDILPDDAFYLEEAFCYLKTGDIEKAHNSAAKALFNNPQDHGIRYLTGLIFLEEKKLDEAIEFFTLAINANNTIPEYYLKRADAKYKNGEYAGAAEDAKIAESFDKLNLEDEVNDLLSLVNQKSPGHIHNNHHQMSASPATAEENENFDENDFD